MNQEQLNVSKELEQQLQQKLNEYSSAEKKGSDRGELSEIYKEIKDIQYQQTVIRVSGVRF